MPFDQPRILAQTLVAAARRAVGAASPGQWLAAAALALSGVAAFGIAPGSAVDPEPSQFVQRALDAPVVTPLAAAGAGYWQEERVRRGDTVGSILARLGIDDPETMAFLRTDPAARPLYQLRPGRGIAVETDDDGRMRALRFIAADGRRLTVARAGEKLVASSEAPAVETRWKMAAGEIRSSLFGAADEAGLPDAVTIQLADVFAGDIDFYKDLQRGDRFAVVYEARSIDGEPAGSGRIVAAEFENRGRVLRAFLWRDADGAESYYAEDGSALRKAFLRSPMEFSRITSGFTNARFHPILQTWRAHKGVDYGAPEGTPVRATANGKVIFAGVQGGYGKAVHLQHSGAHSTFYAHLSRFAPRVANGARVAQGDVIGYVGQTGWATGPHLHYEFRVDNDARNPLTIAMPSGEPLPAGERAAFAARIAPANAQLSLVRSLPAGLLAAAE
jgi:murein DD-endopeptidase MepM/ murein hydrolase activator NlpD